MITKNWKYKILSIWTGQFISLLTSSILQMAIIWYITLKTQSAIMLTLSTLSAFLPQALLGSFVGPFIDRHTKKNIIIYADMLIALASLALGLFALSGNLPMPLIFIVLAIRSLGNSFHEPAAQSLTPLLVPKEKLTIYAGYAQAFDSLCFLLSPSLAILLYNSFDISFIIFLDIIGACLAILIILFIKLPTEHLSIPTRQTNILKETKHTFIFLKTQEGILPLILLGTLYSALYSPVGSLYPHMTIVYFNASTTQSGFVEFLFSSGSLLGALILGKIATKLPKLKGIACSIFIYGLGIFIAGLLLPNMYIIFAILSFFIGTTTPFYHGIHRAILQTTIPHEYHGRTFAISQSSKRLGMPIGLLFGGIFADYIGIQYLFISAGLATIILAIIVLKTPSLQRFKGY